MLGEVNALHRKYTYELYELTLHPDNQFVFYNKEVSIRSIVAGDYLLKNDSIILTTHRNEDKKAVFMILLLEENQLVLEQQFLQKEFISDKIDIPAKLYLKATYYDSNQIFQQYFWKDQATYDYEIYSFNENKNPLSIERFEDNLQQGEQIDFFDDREIIPKTLKHYESGEKSGTWIYLKRENDTIIPFKKEKYKKGKLKKSKQLRGNS